MEGGPEAMEPIEVSGKLFHFNKGAAFFSFHRDGSQGEQICLFRPNKIIIDKQKLGASNFKSVDAIAKVGLNDDLSQKLLELVSTYSKQNQTQ